MLKAGKVREAVATTVSVPRDPLDWFSTAARHPFPFLLESCGSGRYSFVGSNPYAALIARGNRL